MSEEKYTLRQYAQMQGGHEMENMYSNDNNLSFMQSLGEARMFKSRAQIAGEGAQSITNHAFVSMLTLYAMSQDYNSAPIASNYAKSTISRGSFASASPGGTDLYQTLFTLSKPEGLFKNPKDALLMNKVRFDQTKTKAFLRRIQTGQITQGEAQTFFFRMERDLAITDPKLRAARRLTQNWGKLTTAQRTLVATQLDRHFRANALRSDIYPHFKRFAKSGNLIVGQGTVKKIAKRVARGAAAFAVGYAAGKATEL
jgi:hypothetical protein